MEPRGCSLEGMVTMREFYQGKRVFITGHTGFKGAWLSLWLLEMGAQVTGFALDPPTDPSMYALCGLDRRMDSINGDIRDGRHLYKALSVAAPDIVLHLAAQPLVRESYRAPVETFEVNCMGTVNLLEAVRQCPSVRSVVVVTTDKCYKNKEPFWGYRENDELGGYDPYSASKACAEMVTESYVRAFFNPKDYASHRVAIATARAGNVIGGGDFAADRLVPDGVRGLIAKAPIVIRNPDSVRPWQHVLEPLAGYLTLACRLYAEGPGYNGPWNFGPAHESERPVGFILDKLCRLWGVEPDIRVAGEEHYHETGYLKLDSYKAKTLLGYQPVWTLEEALERVVKWSKIMEAGGDLSAESVRQILEYEQAWAGLKA